MPQPGNFMSRVLRVFNGDPPKPRRRSKSRASVVPAQDGDRVKAHIQQIAVKEAYRELSRDHAELARRGRILLDRYDEDDRPLEDAIFKEDVRKDPALRREFVQLLFDKRRAELGVPVTAPGTDDREGREYQEDDGGFNFGAFAQEFVIGMMRDKLNGDPAPAQQNGIMGVLAALAQPGGVADKLLSVAMVNGGMAPHPSAAPPRPPYGTSPALAAPLPLQGVDFVEPVDPGAVAPPPVAAEPHALQPDDLAGVVDLDPEAAAHEVQRVFCTWIAEQNPIMQAAAQGVLNSLLYMELDDALPMLKQYPISDAWARLLGELEQRRPWADELWRHLAGIWDQISEAAAKGEDEGNAD